MERKEIDEVMGKEKEKDDEKKKITHDKMIRGQGQKMESEDGRLNKREMRGEKWTLENNVKRKMSRRSRLDGASRLKYF